MGPVGVHVLPGDGLPHTRFVPAIFRLADKEDDAATVDMASDVEVPAAEPNRLLRSPDVPAVSSEPAPARPVPKDVQETFRRNCRYQK